MNNRFSVELSSDLDYEEMVVYISWDDEPLAVLNCEKGFDNLEIQLYPFSTERALSIPLSDYLEILEFAKNTLINSQKK